MFKVLERIRDRPFMYFGDRNLEALECFLNGYYCAMCEYDSKDDDGVENFTAEFGEYLHRRFQWGMSCGPISVVRKQYENAEEAWAALFVLIGEFRASRVRV